MCFRAIGNEQISFDDRLNRLTDRERRYLDNSWGRPFAEIIFPLIDGSRFEALYCKANGRPNTPANIVVGALLLKEMTGLTDEELLECVLFDIRYQVALHLTSYDEIPFSDRTLSRFRERLFLHELENDEDLLKAEIEGLAAEFKKMLKIDGRLKRTDSAMVASGCKRMGRLELMYTCVSNLVKALVKSGEDGMLPPYLLKYAEVGDKNSVCYRLTNEEAQTRLEAVAAHAFELYKLAEYAQSGFDEFQLLERMLMDQTEDGELKPNKEISPSSLQNPSDEDATFRRKAGKGNQGYVVNFVEDCGEEGNIITEYDFDVNLHSDVDFGAGTIERLGPQEKKTVLIGDGAYASEDNFEAAAENNIELVPTALTGQAPPEIVLEFHIEDNEIKGCPEGYEPTESRYNEDKDQHRAYFDKETCENCPRREECPVNTQYSRARVDISQTTIDRAEYTEKLSTEEYKEYARKRNGVEGIPSVLRRRYRVDEMPVRGLLRQKMWMGLIIGAINIKRVIAATLLASFYGVFLLFFELNLRTKTYAEESATLMLAV